MNSKLRTARHRPKVFDFLTDEIGHNFNIEVDGEPAPWIGHPEGATKDSDEQGRKKGN